MHKPHTIEFLDPTEFKVLKVIQIEGPKHNWFTGHLAYLRDFTGADGYNHQTNDLLDQKILDVVKQSLPDSFLRYSIDILFKGELEDNLNGIRGGSEKGITIQFNPLLPFESDSQFVRKQFYAYRINFNIRLLFTEKEKQQYINDYLMCYLPHNELENYIKTIKAV